MNPQLWITPERQHHVSAALAGNAPWISALARTARQQAVEGDKESPEAALFVRAAVAAWLDGDASRAADAAVRWVALAQEACKSEDLHKGHIGLCGAILADTLTPHLSEKQRTETVAAMRALASAFFDISPGNPHAVGNNWWAVTHSGLYALACALQKLGTSEPILGRTPDELEAWAWSRLRAFLGHFGPGGCYHEGLGYMGYTCSHLLPAVHLRMARTGEDLRGEVPGLAHMAELLFAAAVDGPSLSDQNHQRSGSGRMLSWNDAGLGWINGAAPLLAVALSPDAARARLRARWDLYSGHRHPEGRTDEFCGSLFFHTLFYPEAGSDTPPDAAPLQVGDALHGLWMARNRVRDAGDAVVGAYARAHHPGGHTQHDAGSVRFSAMGWDWILGGGQARAGARWQSRLVPSDHSEKGPTPRGGVLWSAGPDEPPVFGMDLRPVHQAYSERYVALRPGDHAHMAMLDLVDDHRNDRHWDWCLTFSPELACTLEKTGFRLTAPDGTVLDAVFLLDRPQAIERTETPSSNRTFASGKKVAYPGRPVLLARFPGPSLNILVSFRVTPGPQTAVRLAGKGSLDLDAPDGRWVRPFGNALPAHVPERLRNLCRYPA